MTLSTSRILLRELTMDDLDTWFEILSDSETMKYYPSPFDREKVVNWIYSNQENYKVFGFGLWAVVLKESGKMIGDCGITMQRINGKIKPEIGYHIHKDYQRRGYASEAASRCKDFIFEQTTFNMIYSYMKYNNIGSYRVAEKNGMKLLEEYEDKVNHITKVYGISRDEWENNMRG